MHSDCAVSVSDSSSVLGRHGDDRGSEATVREGPSWGLRGLPEDGGEVSGLV